MPDSRSPTPDQFQALKEEFRGRLETFYAKLKLASPYESVEKAIRTLTTIIQALPMEEQTRVMGDPALRWQQFQRAFRLSGAAKKHRGIIAGLARDRSTVDLPPEYDHFLECFLIDGPDQGRS